MEFKGTKGKWEYRNKNNTSFAIEVIDKSFAEVYVPFDADDIYETKADALLISKAPEMLEMLKDLLKWSAHFPPAMDEELEKAKQLIKEATEI